MTAVLGRAGVQLSDEDALIRAILAAPEDRTARLVYADWLDERGDPRAEYLRRLCAEDASDDESAARLREMEAGFNWWWAGQMRQGITRGGLGYVGGYGYHCGLRLDSGKELELQALDQWRTYIGLLEGRPDRRMNDGIIERAMEDARGRRGGGRARLIEPARRPDPRKTPYMSGIDDPEFATEWLPAVVCVGSFGDVYSELRVVWFQDEYAPPIAGPVLAQIRKLDWAQDAYHWTADDL